MIKQNATIVDATARYDASIYGVPVEGNALEG